MHFQNGSSLSVDEQLHRRCQHEAFHFVFDVHLGLLRLFFVSAGLELLFLLFRSVYLQSSIVTARTIHDWSWYWDVPLHIVHAHERGVRNHDWNRHH